MISLVVKYFTYFWTLILGNSLIALALWIMSGISREDENQAIRTLVTYELISNCSFFVCVLDWSEYFCYKYTVVKRGHTEGIEREKTLSQNSQGIALDF